MPALHAGAAAAPAAGVRRQRGGQGLLFGHHYHSISTRAVNRRHQVTCPPMSRVNFGKSVLGSNSYYSPYFNSHNGFHTIHSENSPVKPRIVTVVKPGGHTLRKITLLLNRRSVQTFEQLIADISEALGFPRWKNDRVRKLYSLEGKEIRGISDFFRGDDAFIAMGRDQLSMKNIEMVIEELYPDSIYNHDANKQNWEQSKKLKCRLYDKGLNIDSDFDETEITKNCSDMPAIRPAAKHEGKMQSHAKGEERVRARGHGPDRSNRQLGKPPGKIREGERYFNKEGHLENKLLEESLNETVRCEQCTKEKQPRQTLHVEKQTDVSLENRDFEMGRCQRYNVESRVKMSKFRKSQESLMEGEDVRWQGNDCLTSWKHISRDSVENLTHQEGTVGKWEDKGVPNHKMLDKELRKIKKDSVEPQQALTDRKHRPRLEKCGNCRVKQTCRAVGCHGDAKKERKLQKEDIEEVELVKKVTHEREQEVNQECDHIRADTIDRSETTREIINKQQGLDILRPRHFECRAEVESYYEIGKTIGDGNFAVVKECRVRSADQQYAMKIIDKSKLKGKEDMIENEISIIRSLSHPNIVQLLDDYETETEIYLILEYVKGGDLFDAIIESVKFTEHNAALMITDLCEALLYIHRKNIVHRDLKPENLLVQHNTDKSTTLKLADFGLAMYVTEPIFTVCGTPTYVAPEILSERGYGLEVDMWAAGVILYILLCGFPPFRSLKRDQEELFQIIQLGDFDFLSPYWDSISDAAKDLISRLLVVDPRERYTARQVLRHSWISSGGKANGRNLQREVTLNIERHFADRRRQGVPDK
ncbi:serine/threonine-protein kinase DCLK3 [Rhinatrema bivittatum]|uniref:serine/threonine-protein kinase DCLK3 n=1 Tax=Rhinatrema bivittatum TaxID=194408 RepID=UPI001129DC62|nr:serine/threonine-protein kinase DCLK3 [Rhinatrema bivittatum]